VRNKNLGWLDERIGSLKSFDGSLLGYVGSSRNINADSGQVLRLDSNENFFIDNNVLTSLLAEAVKSIDLRLYDPSGIVELREALGRYVCVPPRCITVSSGSEQLVDLVARLFLEKGDEVVSIVPSFFMYRKRVELEGAKFVEVPLNGDLSLDVDAILENVSSRTKVVFICSPNNPTGNQFGWDEIRALAKESSALIVLDEAYAEFGDFSVSSLAVKERNVIVIRTFSKAFGLAGLRFGYSVSHPELSSVISEVLPYTVSSLVAEFLVRLLSQLDIVEKSVEKVKAERSRLIRSLCALDRVKVLDSKANFVTFKPYEKADLVCQGLSDRGILVKDLGDLPVIGHCLRVTVGLPHMNDCFLDSLERVLNQG